jgi:hypothetical protein
MKTADSAPSECTTNAEAETNPSKVTDAASSMAESKIAEEEEDREHLTHFTSWGKPQARDTPGKQNWIRCYPSSSFDHSNRSIAARVRRLTLSNLPADANLTFVQSLVHGGAIDDMVLMGVLWSRVCPIHLR